MQLVTAPASDSGQFSQSALAAFDALAVIGVILNAVTLVPVVFSTKLRRSPTWSTFISSTLCLSLSYTFTIAWQLQPGMPPFGICFFQSVFVYASTMFMVISYSCFVLDFYLRTRAAIFFDELEMRQTPRIITLLPWSCFVLACVFFIMVTTGASDVQRTAGRFICHNAASTSTLINAIICILAFFFVLPIQLHTSYILYRNWTAFRRMSRKASGRISFSIFIRGVLFVLLGGLGTGLAICILYPPWALVKTAKIWYMILVTIPLLAALLMGLQKDILEAWMPWWRSDSGTFSPKATTDLEDDLEAAKRHGY